MLKELDCKRMLRICTAAFVALQVVLFPLIQLLPGKISAIFSYTSIVLVGLYALVTIRGERSGHILRLGILFTLFADYFLVLSDDSELRGVLCFCVTQVCYFVYLLVAEERTRVRIYNAVSRVALSVALVAVAFIVLGDGTDALAIASVLYYGNLVANVIFAFLRFREERTFAIGLLLFSMCDLCIGLDVLFDSYLELDFASSFFYGAHHNLPWVFYQPSQVLIGLRLGEKSLVNNE